MQILTLMYFKLLLFSLFVATFGMAQEGNPNLSTSLVYAPEIPLATTYRVLKNDTGQPIPSTVLGYINYHRMPTGDVTWKVSNEIEILVFPIGVHREITLSNENN